MSRLLIPCLLASAALCRLAPAGSPDAVVVFNEIQFNPPGTSEAGEWVELFNQMGIKTDISGWRVKGIDYIFPQGTIIEPGGYVVVYKSPTAGELGPFSGSLDNSGELLELINRGGRLMDELNYGDDGRWPVEADGSGATLAKRKPYSANKPTENWTFSDQVGGTPGAANFPGANAPPPTTTVTVFGLDKTWRYNQSGADLGAAWASSAHPVGGAWASGAGVLGNESGLAQTIRTTLSFPPFNNPYVFTYYFETEFELSGAQANALQSLPLRHLVDDGAIFYLNGTEVFRVNMPGGAVTSTTTASGNVEAVLSADIPLPTGAVVAGTNRLSVEVHQSASGNSDIVFGAELDALVEGAVPGSAPAIVLNEMPPAAAANYWLELLNAGSVPVDVGGFAVSVGADPAREYRIPAQVLAAVAILLLDEETLGFRPADTENVFVYDVTKTTVLDGQRQTGRLRGRAAERDGAWLYPDAATPGAENLFTFHDAVVISEIAYNPPALPATPDSPGTYENAELIGYNVEWRFNAADEDLPSNWAATAHAVGGNWQYGGAPIGRESSPLAVPLVTDLTPSYMPATVTYYFEREFDLTAQQLADVDSLTITHQIDDGAVFYLNGTEVGRYGMAAGPVGPETLATTSVGDASIQTLVISADALLAGSNRLSVEVHQSSTGSSDMVFGMKLDWRFALTPFVPGMPFRNSDNQWLEIANRSAAPVDLGGWDFDDGISFNFPAGTILAPGEHACIAASAAEFTAAFPGARLLGEFGGSLSRTGEHLLLRDASGNPADEIRYFDSGRWPDAADGGGSSLELRDLDADNAVAESWAASDESGQTAWKTYRYRGTAAADGGPTRWNEFNIGLLDTGEILVDDLSVVEDPDGARTPMLSNTSFESGAGGWRLRGNHRHSRVTADPSDPGNKVLRIVATSATEHMHNQIETTLLSPVANGREYEISFRARWVSGSSQLLTRLYFTRVARTNVIDRPEHVGTPSAANSMSEPNIGPTMRDLSHSPAVPDANQAVTVSVRAADPDGVSALTLRYSVNGGGFQSVPMGVGAGATYQATIPGQAAAAVVQFYIEATDALGALSKFPAAGSDSRALIKYNDGLAATNGLHNFRVILTNADRDFMYGNTEVMSNDRLGATIIDRESEIYYDVNVRLKGSERARAYQPRVGYNLRFGADQPYRGIHQSMAIDRSEGVGSGQFEFLFDIMIANSGGVISRYYDLIQVITPTGATHTRPAILQMARYDDVFLDSQFENGGDGSVYEYDFVYFPQSTDNGQPDGNKVPQGDGISGLSIANNGDDKERYRFYLIKKNHRDADDYAPIINYCKQMSKSGAAFNDGIDAVIDVDSWLRGMAYAVLSGAGDNAAAGDGHNGLYYAHPDGRVLFLPHDMDFSFSNTRSIFANGECAKLANSPGNPGNDQRKRIYFGHLHDIISTTWNDNYMAMWKTHLSQLSPTQNWNAPNSGSLSPGARGANVMGQITGSIPQIAFNITGPDPLSVNGSRATISGDGWVNVREIRLAGNGAALAVRWIDGNSWELDVPVSPGQNLITLEAVDFSGEVVGTETITVQNTSMIEPASRLNLAISELMYHPADPSVAEVNAGFLSDDAFEYLELMNVGANEVSLEGARFTAGITFDLPSVILVPGARVCVARDRSAFLHRYPEAAGSLLPGEFAVGTANQFSNGGEQVLLVDAAGADIRRFTYDDSLPWPISADGPGFSLVLIDPTSNPDHALAGNWRSSTTVGGNPGEDDSVAFVGDPDADDNGNGLSNFLEHALGSDSPSVHVALNPSSAGGLLFTFSRNLAADDVIVEVEVSEDLNAWTSGGTALVASISQGDGTSLETWAASQPNATETSLYVRLKAISR